MPASTVISIRSRSTGCAHSSTACSPHCGPIIQTCWRGSARRATLTTPLRRSSRAPSKPTPGHSREDGGQTRREHLSHNGLEAFFRRPFSAVRSEMPSLKDLRNRIAATKATQKITKAMQMVAASKLRRAQTAVLAARPYAERMDKVLGNIAAAVSDLGAAPKLLAGSGRDEVYLLV